MIDKVDFGRFFRSAAWALAGVCCVGLLSLGTTNCLPASSDSTGGSSEGGNNSTGGNSGSPTGGTTHNPTGGTTYNPTGGTTYNPTGGTTHNPTGGTTSGNPTGGTTYNPTGGTTYSPTGGTTYAPTGGTTYAPTGGIVAPTGGTTTVTPTGGTTSTSPTGTTVTFAAGKAVGAMTGYGWVALGTADSVTDPTCGAGKTPITAAASCLTSTTWSSTTGLCISGSVPALGTPPDYTGNWGVSVGVNADAAGGGLGQSFSSITIAVSGTPSSGLRAMVHKKGDPDATSYCAALTAGAMPLTSFSTTCYNTATPGTAITAADVPNIDKISVQVSSGAAAIAVSSLCITGITFAK